MTDPAAVPPGLLAGVARGRWRAAEDRLYPALLADPASYQRGLTAVQAVVEELRRSAPDLDALLAAEARGPEIVAAVLTSPPPVPPELLVAAACGMRDRELSAAAAQHRRTAALAAAGAAGQAWALVEGPAVTELTDGASVSVHLDSGAALEATVDPWSGADPFGLQVRVADGAADSWSGTDRQVWLAAYERAVAEIEGGRAGAALVGVS